MICEIIHAFNSYKSHYAVGKNFQNCHNSTMLRTKTKVGLFSWKTYLKM